MLKNMYYPWGHGNYLAELKWQGCVRKFLATGYTSDGISGDQKST